MLTLAATGSEMNAGSVITNWETQEKIRLGQSGNIPSILYFRSVNTFTVPKNQTVYGMVDMMSHVFEQYFHAATNTPLQDRMCKEYYKRLLKRTKIIKRLRELRVT